MGRKVVLRSILVVGLAVAGLAALMGLLTSGQEQVHASPAQVISGEASTSMAELTDYAAPPPPEARPDSLGFPLGPMAVRSPSGPLAPMGSGDTYCVHPLSGTANPPTCTHFFTNVQAAVDAANGGETIKVASGTYTSAAGVLVSVTKSITLSGGYISPTWATADPTGTTKLDGKGTISPVVRIITNTGPITVKVEGFHVLNSAGDGIGAQSANVTVDSCRVYENIDDGLDAQSSNVTVDSSIIYSNVAGVVITDSVYYLENNVIAENDDVGLQAVGSSTGTLFHNTFGRSATGAIISGTANFTNTIFYSHTTGVNATGSAANLSNTLWYSCPAQGVGAVLSSTNVTDDPAAFVDPDGIDYHLGFGSAAFNWGAVTGVSDDLEGTSRPQGSQPDLGAYEGSQPMFELYKFVSDDEPKVGQRIIYTIAVENGGGVTTTSALISDDLPSGITFAGPISIEPVGAGVTGTLPTVADPVTIAAVSRVTVSFPVTVGASLANAGGMLITNTAAVTSSEVTTPVEGAAAITVQAPNLVLTKTVDNDTPDPGQLITYTITVSNSGNVSATQAIISDDLPSDITFAGSVTLVPNQPAAVLATSTTSLPVVAENVTITNGEQVTVSFPVTVSASLAANTLITNTAAVTSSEVTTPEIGPALITITDTAGTRYVATTGDDTDNNCLVASNPCATVQYAVNQAQAGDAVKVATGIYTGSDPNVVQVTESITLSGGYTTTAWNESDPQTYPTILDGESAIRVLHINGAGITPTVEGFDIRNGYRSGSNGGGIYVESGDPTLRNNRIYSNTTDLANGGGVSLADAAILESNVIHDNTAQNGGGVEVDDSDAVLDNNIVADNQASGGGGLYVHGDNSSAHMRHNTLVRNGGHGVFVANNGNVVMTNTIVASHTTGINAGAGSEATLDYTLWPTGTWANGSDTDGSGTINSTNVVTGDPIFVDPNNGDYHIDAGSAAIDEGLYVNVDVDIDGENRDADPDIGADERRICWARVDGDDDDYPTVQGAVDAANAGDLVKVAGNCVGVSSRAGVTQTVYISKELTLAGGYTENDWTTPDPATNLTYLDAQREGRVLYITTTAPITVTGFQIHDGYFEGDGGGLYVNTDDNEATLMDNELYDNRADNGGGLYLVNVSTVTVEGTQIYANDAITDGGGAYLGVTNGVVLSDTDVYSNMAGRWGGGVHVSTANSVTWINSLVYENMADADGGGLSAAALDASLENIHIYANDAITHGGGVYLSVDSATLNEVEIDDNMAGGDGGGLWCSAFTTTLTGTLVYSNTADGDGGGFWWDGATAVLSGTQVYENDALGDGGGGYLNVTSSEVSLTGDQIHDNSSGASGGGLYVTGTVTATFDGVSIYTNIATDDGGGVYMNGDRAILLGGSFYDNWATVGSGGGLYLTLSSDAAFNATQVYENGADASGGGFYLSDGTATLTDTQLYSNTAGTSGGGAYLNNSDNTSFDAGHVSLNDAGGSGGGLYLTGSSDVALLDTEVCTNTAGTHGGGFYLTNSPNLALTGTLVCSNTASDRGGGLYLVSNSTNAVLVCNRILRNAAQGSGADDGGGGLYLNGSDDTKLDNNIVADNQATDGSGVYVYGAIANLRHNTFARNTGNSGVYIDSPGESVVLTNTIVASHTTGVDVGGGTVDINGVLWFNNTTADSANENSITNPTTGDPDFVDPDGGDYHIGADSKAINNGVTPGLLTDIDGELRDTPPDLGADEYRNCLVRLNNNPYPTVQAAVDAANAGDLVKVAGNCVGVTSRAGVTQTVFISQELTLEGGYSSADWNNPDPTANPTYLDAQGAGRVLYITTTDEVTVTGFHIRNGDFAGDGGGVHSISATLRLENNWIYSNTASADGGGVYVNPLGATDVDASVISNEIYNNEAANGGALHLENGDNATLSDNEIHDNAATSGSGGGLSLRDSFTVTLSGNDVYSNTASANGGGLRFSNCDAASLSDNTVQYNTASTSGGGLYFSGSSDATLSDNAIHDNTANTTGGGLYLSSSDEATLDSNTILRNTASAAGGLYLLNSSNMKAYNNFIADNQATSDEGSGVYVNAPSAELSHNTLVNNTGSSGFYVDSGTVTLTNTVAASHTTAVLVHNGTVQLTATLWDGNGTYTDTTATGGGTINTTNDYTGDPDFVGGGDYHIGAASDAIDAGVDAGVARDIDDELRDASPDLGADEYACVVYLNGNTYDTIQDAIDASTQPTDVVKLAGYCVITQAVEITDSLTLQGGYDGSDWNTYDPLANDTELNAQGGRAISITGNSTVTLAGLHVVSGTEGAAIDGATVTITRCRFEELDTGVAITGGDLTLERSEFYGNGDGLRTSGGTYRMDNNIIAQSTGVALWNTAPSTGTLRHNTFAENADGAIVMGTADFTNTIIFSHTVGVTVTGGSTATLDSVLWFGNGVTATGNANVTNPVTGSPDFVDARYHIGTNSAAKDAGVDAGLYEDIDGDLRPMGGFDLGADELPMALSVVKVDTPDPVQVGAVVSYTIYVTNTGGIELDATITDTLRQGGSVLQQDVWTTTLASGGGTWSDVVTFTAGKGCSGTLENEVLVTTDQGATDSYTESTEIVGLELAAVSATAQEAAPTEELTYTLRLTNTGSSAAIFTPTASSTWATVPTPATVDVCTDTELVVTVTVPSTATPGSEDVATVQVEGPAGVSDSLVLTTTVAQPKTKWEKQLYVNGTLTATTPITEVNVRAGDAISIVDQVWVTYTVPTTFTLVEEWTESLTLTQATSDTGSIEEDTGVLTWTGYVTGHHALTKTFDLTDTRSIDYVTETLTVEGADPITQRVVTLRQGCLPVQITSLDSNSPVEVGETMYFTATPSGDKPITYTWDFGEGSPQTGVGLDTNNHAYTAEGDYTVTLNVTNTCPSTDSYSITVTVNPKPGVVWDKDVTVEGSSFDIADPIPVVPGDLVQIVDRVWITYTDTVTYTLVETWTTSLSLTDVSTDSGSVVSDTDVLTWSVAGGAPNAYHTFTKTFTVKDGDLFNYVSEVLTAEQVLTETLSKPLTFRNANVVVTPTTVSVAEGGANDTYDVVLTSAPTDTVTITLSYDAAQVGVSADTLTFDATDWYTAQVVIVSAEDDALDEADTHNSTITHATQSACPSYDGLGVDDVVVEIADNDHTLTVNKTGTGSGTVEPFEGTQVFADGTPVVLTATASSTSTFGGWIGAVNGMTNPVTITMDGPKAITATFDTAYYTLTVATDGTGGGTVDPSMGTHQYISGTTAWLTATADATSEFAGWSGDAGGMANPVDVLMDGDKVVTATFDTVYYTLTVATDGLGSGTVDPSVGTHQYISGTTAWLTATAGTNSEFAGWSGAAGGMANPVDVLMDGDKVVTATFDLSGPTFSIDPTSVTTNTPYAIQVYTLTITNNDTVQDIFDITHAATDTSALVGADLKYNWGVVSSTNSLVIDPGISATLHITVQVPTFEDKWVTHTLTITATSRNNPAQSVTSVLRTHTGGHLVGSQYVGCRYDVDFNGTAHFLDALEVYNTRFQGIPLYDFDHNGTHHFLDALHVYNNRFAIGSCAP